MAEAPPEDAQPQLKYQRLGADVTHICAREEASCLCVTSKVLALGTASGSLHILDVSGDEVCARCLALPTAVEMHYLKCHRNAGQAPGRAHRSHQRPLL